MPSNEPAVNDESDETTSSLISDLSISSKEQ
jgi:hypothetical protein